MWEELKRTKTFDLAAVTRTDESFISFNCALQISEEKTQAYIASFGAAAAAEKHLRKSIDMVAAAGRVQRAGGGRREKKSVDRYFGNRHEVPTGGLLTIRV